MTEVKKILFIAHGHPDLSPGGAERAAYSLYKSLYNKSEFDACFLAAAHSTIRSYARISSRNNSTRELVVNFPPIDYFNFMSQSPGDLRTLVKEIIEYFTPDVIHIHHFVHIGLDLIPILKLLLPKAKIVLTLHEYLLICNNYGQMLRTDGTLCSVKSFVDCATCRPKASSGDYFLRENYIKSILRMVDIIHAPSQFLVKQFQSNGFGDFAYEIIENLQPTVRSDVVKRRKSDLIRIAYFGQINKFKGTDLVIKAALEFQKRKIANIVFDIFGSIYKGMDIEFEEKIASLLEEAKDNVNYRGRYSGTSVVDLMSQFDVVVVPSIWWENSPLVIQEAISAGVYVIGSDIGGVREKVSEYSKGLLFRSGDHFDLVDKIQNLAEAIRSAPPDLEDDTIFNAGDAENRYCALYHRV